VATRGNWRKSYFVRIYREPHIASLFPSTYEQLPVDYEQLPVYYEPSALHEHRAAPPNHHLLAGTIDAPLASANPSPGRAHDPPWGIWSRTVLTSRTTEEHLPVLPSSQWKERDNDAAPALGARPNQERDPAARHRSSGLPCTACSARSYFFFTAIHSPITQESDY